MSSALYPVIPLPHELRKEHDLIEAALRERICLRHREHADQLDTYIHDGFEVYVQAHPDERMPLSDEAIDGLIVKILPKPHRIDH
jgi:hypothetical protein